MAEKPIKIPLPADLPEDWNAGQIIAPDGTAVGLTERHGYNYLMAAVNRAQRGVNEVNEAFGTVSADAARFVVGTSADGWTEADCDFLCDGVDDQVEIQQALNKAGKFHKRCEVVLLSGTYQLSDGILMSPYTWLHGVDKNSVSLICHPGIKCIIAMDWCKISELHLSRRGEEPGEQVDTCDILIKNGDCIIEDVIIYHLKLSQKCISITSGQFVCIRNCTFAIYNTAIYVNSQHARIRIENNYASVGSYFVQMEPGPNGQQGNTVYIVGNLATNIILDGLSGSGENIICGNNLRELKILNTQNKRHHYSGNLLCCNIFNALQDFGGIVVTLGENTQGWFVTGNVLFAENLNYSYTIQDLGTGNVVRFNSDDLGGSTPATVQQATPTITVNADGAVTARATQAAGYVAAGTRSATYQLSNADDTDLTPENIKDGVSIFGVAGTLETGGGTAGVTSFNGRSGEVKPGNNDYTADMVGAVASSAAKDIQVMTQAEYDALASKSPTTLYLIKE